MAKRRVGVDLLVAAAGVGLIHAAFTIYWASGGRWLLRTVGAWAVHLADTSPLATAVVLGGVAVLKIAGALVPLTVETRQVPGRHIWRRLAWAAAVVLIAYGLINVLVAWAVLGGLLTTAGGYDHSAELGHAALWDPLFLLWGLLLAGGLSRTRNTAAEDVRVTADAS